MRDFTRPRGRLRSLPAAARAVYSVFLLFTLAGLTLTGWLAQDMVGLDLAALDQYYAGAPSEPRHPVRPASGAGPALDLPPELETTAVGESMALRKLLEVTHFHLFSMPVYLLVLSHLFMLSRLGEAAKIGWITLATVAVAGHIAAPWLARAGTAGAAVAYGSSGALLGAALLVMSAVPLWEMWGPAGAEAARPNGLE